jgi:hypothetical protein
MTVIQFPKPPNGVPPPKATKPKPIYVFAPLIDQLADSPRKLCLGYSKEEAKTRFYEGGLGSYIEPRLFVLSTAPDWVKYQLVSQLVTLREMRHPLSPVDEDALDRLGDDPHRYGKGPRRPKKRKWPT